MRSSDRKKEREILNLFLEDTPLGDYDIKPTTEKSALYDFKGYLDGRLRCYIEAKDRHILPWQYSGYIISKEKIEFARANLDYAFVFLYRFKGRYIRGYDLADFEPIHTPNYSYVHKRTGKRMSKEVYQIPASAFRWEFIVDG